MKKIEVCGYNIQVLSQPQNKNTLENIAKVLTEYQAGRLHTNKSTNGKFQSLEVSRKERLLFVGNRISYLTHEAYNQAIKKIK